MSKGEEVQRAVSNMLNNCNSRPDVDAFIKSMAGDHRSLQQSFTRLCVAWFQHLAQNEYFDLRNEASVKLAKELKPILDEHMLPSY